MHRRNLAIDDNFWFQKWSNARLNETAIKSSEFPANATNYKVFAIDIFDQQSALFDNPEYPQHIYERK